MEMSKRRPPEVRCAVKTRSQSILMLTFDHGLLLLLLLLSRESVKVRWKNNISDKGFPLILDPEREVDET